MNIKLISGDDFAKVREICKEEFFKTQATRDFFSQLHESTKSWTIKLVHKDKHIDNCLLLATYEPLPATIDNIESYGDYFPDKKFDIVNNSVFVCQFDQALNLLDSKQYGHIYHYSRNHQSQNKSDKANERRSKKEKEC